MSAVNLPYNIINDDPLDADKAMANWQTIAQVVNGSLEGDTNIVVASPVASIGKENTEGVATTLARSDHGHVVNSCENLAADPTTGNFLGRIYYNTSSNDIRMCTDATGAGTYVVVGNEVAAELVVHAAEHKAGGHDPLADNTITAAMRDDQTIFACTPLAGDTNLSTSGWSNLVTMDLTATGVQTFLISVNCRVHNNDTAENRCELRIQDTTAGGTPTIWRTQQINLTATSGSVPGMPILASFPYTVTATGTTTLRLQGTTLDGAQCEMAANDADNQGETLDVPQLKAVIL